MEKKTAHAFEQERPDLLKRRQAWFEDQIDLDPAKLVFIDETGLSTKMARRYGRALRPLVRTNQGAVGCCGAEVEGVAPVETIQQHPLEPVPTAGLLAVERTPPARNAEAAAHLTRQKLPKRSRAQRA